jgi:hypothetical protein
MEENPLKNVMVETASKVTAQAYEDVAHPILKSIGNIVSLPFKAIDAALTPIKKWIDNRNFNYEETKKLLAKKLEKIDVEHIVEPEPYVAVPAFQQLGYSYSSEELRNMYANLLASAMTDATKYDVHPSYVDIIKQLSPTDAKALNKIFHPGFFTVIKVRTYYKNAETYKDIINNFSWELEDIFFSKLDQSKSLLNLVRLGLIEIAYGNLVQPKSRYDVYDKHPAIEALKERYGNDEDVQLEVTKGLIQLTDFGLNFCMTCCDMEFEV